MRRARIALLLAALTFPAAPARADDPIYICAKDMRTQQMYHAMAWATTGVALNNVSHSAMYDPNANFLVVAWSGNRSSIILMNGALAVPTYIPTNGVDESGNAWEISAYSQNVCP